MTKYLTPRQVLDAVRGLDRSHFEGFGVVGREALSEWKVSDLDLDETVLSRL